MTRLNFVKSANKDYPNAGIKKGDSYWWWQLYRQPRQMSKERPKGSQIASSDYARSVLSLIEGLEEIEKQDVSWTSDDRDSLVSDLEQIRDEEQEKFDNLPEGFQMGDVGQRLEEHVGDLDGWIDELNGIEFDEDGENEEALEKALETYVGV